MPIRLFRRPVCAKPRRRTASAALPRCAGGRLKTLFGQREGRPKAAGSFRCAA
ncbi:hypothetical protein [Kingella potus]|uniref:hypothetical protein n=1 Tax=Kingella potus TaxID=265175 RepID=UPI001FD1C3B3|nr:hypothetical protein [Kingella potus]UOP01571.1 hypothetical protein LVJ84_05155 [Kingella potus]